jgi:hypothetical protein
MEEEYDFASLNGGVGGKYADAFKGTATTVLLSKQVTCW